MIRFSQMNARLMARYGGAADLVRTQTIPAINPWEAGTTTITTHTVQIIETGVELDLQPGSVIQAGDLVAAMLPLAGVTPHPVDKLNMGGVSYTVMSVRPVRSNPEGPVIHFILHGRR